MSIYFELKFSFVFKDEESKTCLKHRYDLIYDLISFQINIKKKNNIINCA